MTERGSRRAARRLTLGLLALTLALFVLGSALGSSGLDLATLWQGDPLVRQIVLDIRLPRTFGAWLTGALLGQAGAIAQGLFRNPLADPYLLGSASGASLFVALTLAFGAMTPASAGWASQLGLNGAAFAGAMVALMLTMSLARGLAQTMRLVLAGVVIGVVLGALSTLIVTWNPEIMPAQHGFSVGSTALIGWSATAVLALALIVTLPMAWLLSPLLDALALGEHTARSLGLPVGATRAALMVLLALATGAAVAQAGLIAFVGLAAPHMVRSWVRGSHRGLVTLSVLAGGVLLASADLIARALAAPRELPVGVLTAVLGGAYLLWLMRRQAREETGRRGVDLR